jgi:hypothetical protein
VFAAGWATLGLSVGGCRGEQQGEEERGSHAKSFVNR